MRGELTVGIEPQRLGHEVEPGLAQRLDRAHDAGRQPPAQPDEGPPADECCVELPFRHLEQRGQSCGDPDGIPQALGLREERFGRGRGGERRPVTIDDGPALRVQDLGAGVLTLGERGQLGVADDL